jgi:hypothetical protein
MPIPPKSSPTSTKPAAKTDDKAPAHDGQVCQKCGAMFRWERSHSDDPRSPLTLKLIEPSRRCDCGYGKVRRR